MMSRWSWSNTQAEARASEVIISTRTAQSLLHLEIRREPDVVLVRQRGRQLAALLRFSPQEQTRISTALSELARNAYQYAGGGSVRFGVEPGPPPSLVIQVEDRGPGIPDVQRILDGEYVSTTSMGVGLLGVRRLMDEFRIETAPGGGTTVSVRKHLPSELGPLTPARLAEITAELVRARPENAYEEVQQQNQELLRTLDELARLSRELEDTNRGVVALYAELDEHAGYLKRASELKSEFLSNMSHEFRTPLNAINSLSRLLLEGAAGTLSSEQEKPVSLIRKAALDLTELVDDLLDLAKVEAGKVNVRPVRFPVEDLFAGLRGMLRPLLEANSSVELHFEAAPGLVLHTDESKVSQVLRNFISNALKYTERGEIRVSARSASHDTIVFSVRDTGVGIAPGDQERIFEEFVQVEGPHQRRVKGTGLGLPLCRKLAELLGGWVTLESSTGAGSAFSLVLPREYWGAEEEASPPAPALELDPSRQPVLVVEDSRETLFLYEKYLAGSPYQMLPARTLWEARQKLQEVTPAAIILDVLLERESTWDFLQELKTAAETARIPTLVITMVDNERKALALGAEAFGPKPVDAHWLLHTLAALTGPGLSGEK